MRNALKALLFCGVFWSTAALCASEKLKVGDIWAYKNRPGEETSTLTILKVENYPKLGKVVHIRVDNIRMINPVNGGEFNEMPHLPFQARAIERSITQRVGKTAEIPDFSKGYEAWRAAFDQGKAGVFKITVRQTLDGMISGNWEVTD
ncbi:MULTISPECIES: hypothetical protein [unclassified Pseudomonas]|uniref:hypothetical protein n=1 Tax=unclassified Pseudomonas TaxID=196821 RepID=UPI000CD201BE|nr:MULTISPECIES: hypothetical protein [unclassified Pseudomonas]POA29614.1 hypothetical protein C1887_18725 [Pseudomonas sp. GW456-R21]POA70090.1 hypothetical protein C1884_05470 [Pseudomonas sp. GW460-R15]